MAILRLLNEFGLSDVILALEPARKCVCHCTYCFAELNSKAQAKGRTKSFEDKGTFESTIEKACGPDYDPTNFLQWSVRNRLAMGYANTVEPFQDLPQATGILKTTAALKIPLFIQTKGHNFAEVWPLLKEQADNIVLFVSFPTPDDRALKRFEPGTPRAADRIRVIETAASAGIPVILALSPYHEDWCRDPGGFVRDAISWGVESVFLDRLHINRRQEDVAADRVMVEMAKRPYDDRTFEHLDAIYESIVDGGIGFIANDLGYPAHGYPFTQTSICPGRSFERGRAWPYHHGKFLTELDLLAVSDEEDEPIVVTWTEALKAMEADGGIDQADGGIDQPFSRSSLRELMVLKNLPSQWLRSIGEVAPIRDYYRALWNTPTRHSFAWMHPHARVAERPDGQPWTDENGDIVMVFDHSWREKGLNRRIEAIDELSSFQMEA